MRRKDDSWLKLEKKWENNTEKDIIMTKFNFSKPTMKLDHNFKLNKAGLNDFLEKMKRSNFEIEKNKDKYNIENNDENNSNNNSDIDIDENSDNQKQKNKEPIIEWDWAMGILEQQKKKDLEVNDILKGLKNENENENDDENNLDIKGTKEWVNFIIDKK